MRTAPAGLDGQPTPTRRLMLDSNGFLDAARPLALHAAARLMELRTTDLQKEHKPDHSLVTNADREADTIIRAGLAKAFPDHAILTEESSFSGDLKKEFVWVVDPLDGTRAYAKGRAGFSVMIGLLRHGVPFAGVVVDPLEGHLFQAVQGEGATHTLAGVTTPLHVSSRREWGEMPLISSTGFPDKMREKIQQALPCPWLPAINSVGIKVGIVVRQLADLYLNHHTVHLWDTCGPQIILEEAGGVITYTDGSPLRYMLGGEHQHPMPTLASNGTRHEDALRALGSLLLGF